MKLKETNDIMGRSNHYYEDSEWTSQQCFNKLAHNILFNHILQILELFCISYGNTCTINK